MFFKIIFGITAVLIIVICVNGYFPANDTLMSTKIETGTDLSLSPQKESPHLRVVPECKSYIATTVSKICIVSNDPTNNIKDTEIGTEFKDYTNIVSPVYPQFVPGNLLTDKFDNTQNNPENSFLKLNKQKVEPGTIFIPFSTKNCGMFCK